jgi:hypothetical protein
MTFRKYGKGTIMPINIDPKIVSKIPLAAIFRLISDLIRFSKGGISKEEGAVLLQDLADIAGIISKDLAE